MKIRKLKMFMKANQTNLYLYSNIIFNPFD